MAEASRVVLGGLEIGTDVKIVRPPHRYEDARGRDLFDRITGLLAGMTAEAGVGSTRNESVQPSGETGEHVGVPPGERRGSLQGSVGGSN